MILIIIVYYVFGIYLFDVYVKNIYYKCCDGFIFEIYVIVDVGVGEIVFRVVNILI